MSKRLRIFIREIVFVILSTTKKMPLLIKANVSNDDWILKKEEELFMKLELKTNWEVKKITDKE